MKLKRFVSAALFVSLLLGLFAGVSVSAEESAVQVAPNNLKEASVLYSLGIIDAQDEGVEWESTSIKNRQFLTYVINMTNYDGIKYSYMVLPTDEISSSDKDYNKYVYAFLNGWLKDETGIAPDKELTVDFAVTLLRGVLGYTGLIENGKSDIEGRLLKELMNGVKADADGKLTLNAAIKMLYNAIGIDYCEEVFSGSYLTWEINEDETVLSLNRNIYKIKGRVTATNFATIIDETVGEGQIRIDDMVYDIDDKSFNSFIGKNVEAYVYVDNNESKVMYLEVTSTTSEIVIDGENFESYTPEMISYYNENGSLKSIRVSDPIIIYNGKELQMGEYSDSLFDITEGNVTLLKNNGVVDVIVINKYKNLVVGTVDKDDLIVTDMFSEDFIDFDCDEFSLKNELGKEVEISSVKKKNVITYTVSLDGQYINAVVGGMNITEKITGVQKGNGNKYEYLKIGSVGYYAAAEFAESTDTIVLGEVYDLFINVNNRIVAVKAPSGLNVNLAYMTAAGFKDQPFEEVVMIKAYTVEAVDEEDYTLFECAEKVRVDGTNAEGKGIINALKVFDGTLTIPITYGLNSEGKIKVIDTPNYVRDKENDNSLVRRVERTNPINVVSTISYGYRNHFGGRYYLSWDGICINHPSINQTTHSAEKKDEIVITDRVRTNLNRYTDLYSLGYDSPIVYFSIADDNSSNDPSKVSWRNETVIVKEIVDSLKDDDSVGTFVTLVNEGNEICLELSQKYKDDILKSIDEFDIIRYKTDAKEEIIAAEQILDYSNLNSTIGNESIGWSNTEYRFVVGKCYDTTGDPACRTAAHKNLLSFFKNPTDIENSMEVTYLKNAYLYTVEKDEVSIKECTPDMIRTYKGLGDNADMVVLVSTWNAVPTAVYIIRAN